MIKKVFLLGLILVLVPAAIASAESDRVGVVPFTVYSQEDLNYLSQGVQEMLIEQLVGQGYMVESPSAVVDAVGGINTANIDEAGARNIGRRLKVQYIVYGSLTKVGSLISLDARMVNISGGGKTVSAFVQQTGLENLNVGVRRLADELTDKLEVGGGVRIADIKVQGNKRIEVDAIKGVIQSKAGGSFSNARLSEDLKRVYDMGYFEDVQVDVQDSGAGKVITFSVEERPAIAEISYRGNMRMEAEELGDVLGFSLFSILDTRKLAESIENIKNLYREKGYFNAEVTYETTPMDGKRIGLTYKIDEGGRVYVEEIEFIGNKAFDDGDLQDEMETSTHSMFSFFTDAGILKQDVLENDIQKIQNFYFNNGYIKARIGDPDVERREDGLYIKIPVEEGPQYTVGDLSASGDLIFEEEEILEKVKQETGDTYNRETMMEDVRSITTMYADKGYAYARVRPRIAENNYENTVAIDFVVAKGDLVSFERISIVGNDKTRDKVIRRELAVREGEQFSAEGLKKSSLALNQLGYFEDVQFITTKGSTEDKMNLKVQVKERPTGAFSVGAGYSSYDGLFGMAKISQDNLFGTGRKLSVQGTIGGSSTDFSLSFTEPWLFDRPISAGFDIFSRTYDFTDYDKESTGFSLRAGYWLWEEQRIRLTGRYLFEEANVTAVNENASIAIRDSEGESTTSSLLFQLRRNTKNSVFNPTEGSDNSIIVERAGGILGGTNHFTKYIVDSGWFIPTFWDDVTFFVRGKAGVVHEDREGGLPIFEKFYLGGINSVRGFKWGDISPRDPVTGERIGGEYMALANVELVFPLVKEAGLMGVVFYDQGNVWDKDTGFDLGDMKKSYGAGVRYFSPLGPLRIEYGRVIDPLPNEPSDNWEFTVGTFF